jgi:hypothetical protein
MRFLKIGLPICLTLGLSAVGLLRFAEAEPPVEPNDVGEQNSDDHGPYFLTLFDDDQEDRDRPLKRERRPYGDKARPAPRTS